MKTLVEVLSEVLVSKRNTEAGLLKYLENQGRKTVNLHADLDQFISRKSPSCSKHNTIENVLENSL